MMASMLAVLQGQFHSIIQLSLCLTLEPYAYVFLASINDTAVYIIPQSILHLLLVERCIALYHVCSQIVFPRIQTSGLSQKSPRINWSVHWLLLQQTYADSYLATLYMFNYRIVLFTN